MRRWNGAFYAIINVLLGSIQTNEALRSDRNINNVLLYSSPNESLNDQVHRDAVPLNFI